MIMNKLQYANIHSLLTLFLDWGQWLGLNKDLKSLAVETTANQVCILIIADNQFLIKHFARELHMRALCCRFYKQY